MKISVVICTYNPRIDYLERVLSALKVQTVQQESWELLLVDNASQRHVSEYIDLTWHPTARHIRENEPGLTPARLRGIAEAKASLIVFVDDDNVLNPNFLENSLWIASKYPYLGAWGGTIKPEFEAPPPAWTRPHWGLLAIRQIEYPIWGNAADYWPAQPCGAGLCVRMAVARQYLDEVSSDALRRSLDRKGTSLLSTGDSDLVWTCRKLGLGWGNFPQLELIHLLPSSRFTESYLLKLVEGMTASFTALSIRNGAVVAKLNFSSRLIGYLKIIILNGLRSGRFLRARWRGVARGIEMSQK